MGITQRWFNFYSDPSGTVKVRLPKGEYLVQGDQAVQRPGTENYDIYMMVQPLLELTSDKKVVMDARTTKPVTTTIPAKDGKPILADIGYDRTNAEQDSGLSSTMLAFDFDGLHTAQVGGSAPAGQMAGHVNSAWGKLGADGRFSNTPFFYGLVNMLPDGFFTGFHRAVQAKELATVTQQVNATGDRRAERVVMPSAPGLGGAWTPILNYDLPAKATLLVDAGPVGWQTDISEFVPDPDPEVPWTVTVTRLTQPDTKYRAGKTYHERYNAATFAPAPLVTIRDGNTIALGIFSTSDADGHGGVTVADSQGSKLYRDGKLVGESEWFGDVEAVELPAAKGSYKFVTSLDRSSLMKLSSKIDLTFTFSSAQTASGKPIPLRTVGYQPAVDSRNTVKRSPVTVLPITLAAQPTAGQKAALPAVKKLALQVSGDNGKTWKPAAVVRVGAGYKAIFATPKGAAVSLKAHLVDAAGNTTDQTVIGAYLLR